MVIMLVCPGQCACPTWTVCWSPMVRVLVLPGPCTCPPRSVCRSPMVCVQVCPNLCASLPDLCNGLHQSVCRSAPIHVPVCPSACVGLPSLCACLSGLCASLPWSMCWSGMHPGLRASCCLPTTHSSALCRRSITPTAKRRWWCRELAE